MRNQLLLVLSLAVVLSACDSQTTGTGSGPGERDILVANGGNFSDQNGSVSQISVLARTAAIIASTEGFVQAVEPAGANMVVLVNTFSGGRLDILASDGTPAAHVEVMAGPRAATVVEDMAYVTTFDFSGRGQVLAIDLQAAVADPEGTSAVRGSWPVGSYPEGIAHMSGRLFVANTGFIGAGRTLSVLNPESGVASTIDLGCDGPRDVIVLNDQEVAVVCHGKTVYNDDFSEVLEQTPGEVVFVDPQDLVVAGRVAFDTQVGSTGGGQAATASPEILFVLEGHSSRIRRIVLASRQELSSWQLPDTGRYVGVSGVAWDGNSVWVGRMARAAGGAFPDFTAAGQLVQLKVVDGSRAAAYPTGPAPTHVVTRSTP